MNRIDHLERIQRAVDFIEERLAEELSLEAIARHAGYSLWHFQTVFHAIVGDTIKGYIRRRRLCLALATLQKTEGPILDIALAAGFESQEAFTRAFKAQFGLTPGQSREKDARIAAPPVKPKITLDYLQHLTKSINMTPQFKDCPEKLIVGMGATFISVLSPDRNNFIVIPKLWSEYIARAHEIPHRTGGCGIGLCTRPPEGCARAHPEECYYVAGTEVTKIENVPAGMTSIKAPAGRYAVFTHKGKVELIGHTMNYIYSTWLPRSGVELREAPDLEIYDNRFNPNSDDSELDIWIPVV